MKKYQIKAEYQGRLKFPCLDKVVTDATPDEDVEMLLQLDPESARFFEKVDLKQPKIEKESSEPLETKKASK